MLKILLIGKSGRVDCIADALYRSPREKQIFSLSEVNNPGLIEKSAEPIAIGKTDDKEFVLKYARKVKPDFAIIGPEEPLEAGVVDELIDQLGIPCVGPRKSLARLESSKSFTRNLLAKHSITGNPAYKEFKSLDGIKEYLTELGEFVVKPDGLTGGKGVKVFGEHLMSIDDGLKYCSDILCDGNSVVIEEKLVGEEFSLQAFCDGKHVINTIPIQDHKRAYNEDTGPNTGGMGTYSCEDHLLPFLSAEYVKEASEINNAVANALREEFEEEYKGIIYGGFMITKNGLRLIEYNARFGDPEVMNLLPLLETDFISICEAIINGTLDQVPISFRKKATVCKYVVPEGYPSNPEKDGYITMDDMPPQSDNLRVYYGAVNKKPDGLQLIGSRAVACVGIGDTLKDAEQLSESAASKIKGHVRHRTDIGTEPLIQKRINHVRAILDTNNVAVG